MWAMEGKVMRVPHSALWRLIESAYECFWSLALEEVHLM